MKRKVISFVLVFALLIGMLPLTAFADSTKNLSECEVLIDGEGWKVFPVEGKNDELNATDLNITVVDQDGKTVPSEAYEIVFGTTYWDEEKEEDVFSPISEPFSLTINDDYMQSGFGGFAVYAAAKEGGGYTGQTESREFMLWHKYSFNWFGANADFGEKYKGQSMWSWHDFFEIPVYEIKEPVIHGIAFEDVDPQYYEITYYERGEIPDFDDPEYDQKLYPETDPLDQLPSDMGKYFARIEGKEPYYGVSYVDFDIIPVNLSDCEVLIDGEGWKVFAVDELSDTLSNDDLHITVVDPEGNEVPQDAYELVVGTSEWNEELGKDDFTELSEPYALPVEEEEFPGFGNYAVYAVAQEDGGYTGQTESRYFMIWHKYSFNYFGANADFGEEYKAMSQMTWHDRYVIPSGRVEPPVIHGIVLEDEIDPAFYEITYYYRHDEVLPDVDPFDPAAFEYDEQARYPENDPAEQLDGMPTKVGTYFARIEGKEPYYGTSYVDFDIVQPSLDDCELRFRGEEEWAEDYYLNSKEETLTLEQLGITVVDKDENELSSDAYTLQIGVEADYDDDKHEPIIEWYDGPYGLITDEAKRFGFQMHCVKATAKDGSGYEGETRIFEFMIRDKHSLDRDGAYIDFGEQYIKTAHRSWHYYYEIPQSEIKEPDVYNSMGEKLDPSMYTLTCFERNDMYDSFEQRYSETHPLAAMPTAPGSYFVRLEANEPYYGTSYADFDILAETVSYAMVRGSDRRYYEGDTIYMPQNSEIYVSFDLSPYNGMIPGWRDKMLQDDGFAVEYQGPFEDEGTSYAHIQSGDLAGGSVGTLYYDWYRVEDVFDEYGGMHWDTAVPVMSCSVKIAVMPDQYDYLLGDADGDGDVTILDVTTMQRFMANLDVGADEEALMQGDVDGDDELTVIDAAVVLRWLTNIWIPCEVGKPITE